MNFLQNVTQPFAIIFLFAIIVALPACGRRQAQNLRLHKQWNVKCKEAADLLASINDVASARAAEPKLKVVLQELAKVDEQLQTWYDSENVDGSDRPAMTKEVAAGIGEMQRLNQETLRISKDPELRAALGETWKKIPSVFMLESVGAIPKS